MRQGDSGFTMIELLLYIAIVSIFVLTISILLIQLMQTRSKNQAIAEVEQQGQLVMQRITQSVRNGTAITTPTAGNTTASLSVTVTNGALSPTVFDLAAGVIRSKEGVAAVVPLTSSHVTASSLSVRNLSRTGTPNIIRISFTLTYVNPSGRNEFDYNKTFITSVALRR